MLLEPSAIVKWIADPNRGVSEPAVGTSEPGTTQGDQSHITPGAALLLFSTHTYPIVSENDQAEMFPGIDPWRFGSQGSVSERQPCPYVCTACSMLHALRVPFASRARG